MRVVWEIVKYQLETRAVIAHILQQKNSLKAA